MIIYHLRNVLLGVEISGGQLYAYSIGTADDGTTHLLYRFFGNTGFHEGVVNLGDLSQFKSYFVYYGETASRYGEDPVLVLIGMTNSSDLAIQKYRANSRRLWISPKIVTSNPRYN